MKVFPYGFVKKTYPAELSNYNTNMGHWRVSWKLGLFALLFCLAIALPYLYAAYSVGDGYIFGGFLMNPMDGNSYLAKMYQGWQGDWQFTLPYTADPGEGAYLFIYYLFLGHLSRLLGAPLLVIYHLARGVGALFLFFALYRFCMRILPGGILGWLAFALAAFGTGLGWLGLPFGVISADFWVAEAYPFLSAYTNAHFPLTLGIALWLLTPPRQAGVEPEQIPVSRVFSRIFYALLGFVLALISPFAVVVVLVVCLAVLVARRLFQRGGWISQVFASRMIWVAVGGLPVLAYDLWAIWRSPQLSAWNAQNITPSLPVWDLLLSFSPLLFLAMVAAWRFWRERNSLDSDAFDAWLVPLAWALTALILVYFPFNLQRRFITGLYVPLSVLAVWGLEWLSKGKPRRLWMLAILLFILVLPTNLFLLLTAHYGLLNHDPLIVLRQDEYQVLQWLEEHTPQDALVLASPGSGLFIPAHSGRRVIYGHPYETAQAQDEKQAVLDFYSSNINITQKRDFLLLRGVDYVLFGPQEHALGELPNLPELSPVFRSGEVALYAVTPESSSSSCRFINRLLR